MNQSISPHPDLEAENAHLRQALAEAQAKIAEYERRLAAAEGAAATIAEYERRLAAAEGAAATIAEYERRLKELNETYAVYKLVLDESSDPIFAFYHDGTYRYVNKAFAAPFGGRTPDQVIGKKIWDIMSKEEADMRYRALKSVFESGILKTIEVRVPTPEGDTFYITTIKPILAAKGTVEAVICISKNITERKRIEEDYRYLSTHDMLTGVYNRNYFERELLRLQENPPYPVAILMADVDSLKEINDRLGHPAGDEALRKIGRALQQSFRVDDLIARIGGDEFAVLLPETGEEAALEAIERIRQNLAAENDPLLRLSLGYAIATPSLLIGEALKAADDRMYRDKEAHRTPPFPPA